MKPETSRYCCPVCREPLAKLIEPNGITVFCGVGKCYSHEANQGGTAANESDAFSALLDRVNAAPVLPESADVEPVIRRRVDPYYTGEWS